MEPGSWPARSGDYEFLMSAQARQVTEDEGIIMLEHEPLRQESPRG